MANPEGPELTPTQKRPSRRRPSNLPSPKDGLTEKERARMWRDHFECAAQLSAYGYEVIAKKKTRELIDPQGRLVFALEWAGAKPPGPAIEKALKAAILKAKHAKENGDGEKIPAAVVTWSRPYFGRERYAVVPVRFLAELLARFQPP